MVESGVSAITELELAALREVQVKLINESCFRDGLFAIKHKMDPKAFWASMQQSELRLAELTTQLGRLLKER